MSILSRLLGKKPARAAKPTQPAQAAPKQKSTARSSTQRKPAELMFSEGEDIPYLRGPSGFLVEVVGESHYQPALKSLCKGKATDGNLGDAVLFLEDSNQYDALAVRVDIAGKTVGYLDRAKARKFRKWLAKTTYEGKLVACHAKIRGGWKLKEGGKAGYGVYLDLPVEFV